MTNRRHADWTGGRTAADGSIRRRDYLKSAAAATAIAGGLSGVASGAAYETIVADNQTIRVEDGETWSNKLVDFGDRNKILISATGTDWTIENVGFRGKMPAEQIFSVADTGGGTSRIENVYVGEGDVDQPYDERGSAIWVDQNHDGHLDVVNVNFQVAGNNGIYGSAPGYNGEGGTITLEGCYAVDNHHTAYRLAADGDEIRNCVAVKSGERPANRGIWIWDPGPVEIHDTDVVTNGEGDALVAREGTTVDCYDFQYDVEGSIDANGTVTLDDESGTDPDPTPPDGVPRTPEEAAAGVSDERSFDHVLTVDGAGHDGTAEYSFATEGVVVRSTSDGATVDGDDRVVRADDGSYAVEGSVDDDADVFEFDGRPFCLDVDPDAADVTLDGEAVDPGDYRDGRVYVEGSEEAAAYELTLTGEPTPSDYLGAVAEPDAAIEAGDDGTWTVGATVEGAAHAFLFSGDLRDVAVESDAATVYADGAQVFPEPETETSVEDLGHRFAFDAADADTHTDYYFEIEEGPIVAVAENGATVDEDLHWISDDGTRAAGRVEAGDRDAYRFDTLLCDVTVDGPATAIINGSESTLDRYPQDCATGDDWKGGFPWQDEASADGTPTDDGAPTDDPTATDDRTSTDGGTTVGDRTATDDGTPAGGGSPTDGEGTERTDPEQTEVDGPGFTGAVTLGALAASGAAILRRFRSDEPDD